MSKSWWLCGVGLALLWSPLGSALDGSLGGRLAPVAQAEDLVASQMFGLGVHAFHAGSVEEAFDYFDRAAQREPDDPRVFYFRGLAYLRLGRPDEADADFRKAAELETTRAVGFYNVNQALERVQGRPRVAIEQIRRQARIQAQESTREERELRREQVRVNQDRVIERSLPGARVPTDPLSEPTAPLPMGPVRGAPAPAVPPEDLEEGPAPAAPAPAAPAPAPAVPPADPFAEPPAPTP